MTEKEEEWNPSSRNLRKKIRNKVSKIIPRKVRRRKTIGEKRRGVIKRWLLTPIKKLLESYVPFSGVDQGFAFVFFVFPIPELLVLSVYPFYGSLGLVLYIYIYFLIYCFLRFFFPEWWSKN